eukprot:307565_1
MSESWKLQIEAYGEVTNGVIRLKLEGLNEIFDRYRSGILFNLEYKIIKRNEESDWKSERFDGDSICYEPTRHLNVKVDRYLYDYHIKMRVAMIISNLVNFPDEIDNKKVIKHKWFGDSECININIPSLMTEPKTFKINDWVEFKKANINENKWTVGELINIQNNDDIEKKTNYTVLYNGMEYELYELEDIQYCNYFHYIDLSNHFEADNCLIIGDRKHVNKERLKDLYLSLIDIFKTDYGYTYMWDQYWCECDFMSMAQCISLNVIDFLWLKVDKGYKIKCIHELYKGSAHHDKTLRLFVDRKWHIGKAAETREPNRAQEIIHICNICSCLQGECGWIFECKPKKESIYYGHDLCLQCVYNMIKTYDQLYILLMDLLSKDLTNDCIQSIATFVAGDVVKL